MDFAETFKEEAFELLGDLESNLLELEKDPSDSELINAVFRALHTIKGSGAMFGFDRISEFSHEVENIYERVRLGELLVDPTLVSLTLDSQDLIRKMLEGEDVQDSDLQQVLSQLEAFRESPKTPESKPAEKIAEAETEQEETTYRIRFEPFPDLLQNGSDPSLLLDELHELGPCIVTTKLDKVPPFSQMDPEHCYCSWQIMLSTTRGEDAIRDVFIFVEDECELHIEETDTSEEAPIERLGEILIKRGDLSEETLNKTLEKQRPIGELLTKQGALSPEKVENALAEQNHLRQARERTISKRRTTSIRVQSEKLDTLVDLVGELVTIQARLSQIAMGSHDSQLINVAETVEQLTWELRDSAMSIRMLPIGTTFDKFKRLVRDLSKELGKEIQLKTSGSETELDKNVLEQLNDPMVHLIRNSIDHGIETPETRIEAGKDPQGSIHLSAHHAGANVIISIRDDGGGMDKERILEKAISKGLVDPEQHLNESDIFGMILLPGFSTKAKITSTSGRGVGMDVVKKNIEALNGSIEIFSEPGSGTEMKLKLPLTLAIIEGLLVEVSNSFYVIPLSLVEECIELPLGESKNRVINLRGEFVPYIFLQENFDLEESQHQHRQIVLTQFEETKLGIVVDRVVGEHQTVIKNLGSLFKDVEEVSGATILGDGTLALILDVPKLYRSAQATYAS